MKDLIEQKANLQIRKGYEKHLQSALNYFNISSEEQVTDEIAYKIIKFINNSNSRISESFYILQKNLQYDDYIDDLNDAKEQFIKSAYRNTNRQSAVKKNNSYFSRGYSGYTEINNEKYYCRSIPEFVYIHYLIENNPESQFKMEEQIYYFDEFSYKPDILEYVNNKLVRIYEIKDSLKKFNDEKYIIFEKYFKEKDIEFIKLYRAKEILKDNQELQKKLNIWKNTKLTKENFSLNNPMLGVKQRESTKKLIGEKAKARFQDKEFYAKYCKNQKEAMSRQEVREKISKSAKSKYEKIHAQRDLDDPFEIRICVSCGNEFQIRKSNPKQTCTTLGCEINFKLQNGWVRKTASQESLFKAYKNRILNYYKTIVINENININEISDNDLIEYVKKYKIYGVIPAKFGMTSKFIINKYFNNFENLKKEIKNYENYSNED